MRKISRLTLAGAALGVTSLVLSAAPSSAATYAWLDGCSVSVGSPHHWYTSSGTKKVRMNIAVVCGAAGGSFGLAKQLFEVDTYDNDTIASTSQSITVAPNGRIDTAIVGSCTGWDVAGSEEIFGRARLKNMYLDTSAWARSATVSLNC